MKLSTLVWLAAALAVTAACQGKRATSEYRHVLTDGQSIEIPLHEVPAHVLYAAEHAVEGFTATEAEMEIEDGVLEYELEGTAADGLRYEIDVLEDGTVVEVETDHDEDDGSEDDGSGDDGSGDDDDDDDGDDGA